MSIKQDRTGARTIPQLEQKYSFGKKFSEIIGLIDDSRDHVDSVESSLRDKITETETILRRDTENIVFEAKQTITDQLESLSSEVEMKVSAYDVQIQIDTALDNGVDRVETQTGYTFDADGLNITKRGEQMTNLIDNTGMYVTRSGEEILTANHEGVNAVNLHAKTYLIIGAGDGTSRFEDYGNGRTGCFFVGGN